MEGKFETHIKGGDGTLNITIQVIDRESIEIAQY